jgi:fructose/tagatose bisphosphate aldolase
MNKPQVQEILDLLDGSVQLVDGKVVVTDNARLRERIYRLAEVSALESGLRQGLARYITRLVAEAAGTYLASINDLYLARGRGEVPSNFTVPAINLRALTFEAAKAVFRAAKSMDASANIFEIARSEMGYTDQRPAEYVTSVLAAAITEGHTGPVFIQGDHFQVSAKRYAGGADSEVQSVRDLIKEAIEAGFYNIDIDTSTLVDLDKSSIAEQQALNTGLSAMYTAYIRELEPEGITVSVGGEIGEVGGQNSTEEELRAYMDGFKASLAEIGPELVGISKISIQTGTSHGGVVLPDGSIADVSVDFGTLLRLSRVAREEYGLAGAVQHGASTLPESAFGKFVESEACEVHLATNFQNMMYDRIPADLKREMYDYLDEKNAADRKVGMTDEQFYYKTRKNALGPFKSQLWSMSPEKRDEIGQAWEDQFRKLFKSLALEGTRQYVEKTTRHVPVKYGQKFYLGEALAEEDVSDLAD